jgi:hypothetical protein
MLRSQRRIRLAEPVRTRFNAGRSQGQGLVCDVSFGGFFVRSPLLPPEGAQIVLSLSTPSGWRVAVRGEVRWNTANAATDPTLSGFGVRLTRPSPEYAGFVDGALAAVGPREPLADAH